MPSYEFEIVRVLRELENDCVLAEALFFSELSRYERSAERAGKNLNNSLPRLLNELPIGSLSTRRAPEKLDAVQVKVELSPRVKGKSWEYPLELHFPAVVWQSPPHWHGFLPSLGIEVLEDSREGLLEAIPGNVLAELNRRGETKSLNHVFWRLEVQEIRLERKKVHLDLKTIKKRASDSFAPGEKGSLLTELASRLSTKKLSPAYEVEEELKKLVGFISGQSSRSVLLVGDSGVGKTALIHELVRRKREFRLPSVSFWETTGSRIMVGADSFGDWQERCQGLVKELSKEKAVLVVGNLYELAEVARHASTPRGMAGYFRPFIQRGDILVLAECNSGQREILEREHPQLLEAFQVMEIPRPSSDKVRRILSSVASGEGIEEEALITLEALHRRYCGYSAYPGRPLRFLRHLFEESSVKPITSQAVNTAFSAESGMPQFMLDDEVPLSLDKAEKFFSQRLIGQELALQLVVDILAGIKAKLAPPGKAIASLLFVGPTGVGKTEMTKLIAEFLFQDRQKILRFDMSEYADPSAVARLVGGMGQGRGLLTSKVREQSFGVVLFDELEKADPSFFDLLLQILGEGRLTDEAGRTADFTNSLIVMTSNLGARGFTKSSLGLRGDAAKPDPIQYFSQLAKKTFRPELYNRIDRIVPFAGLSQEQAQRVAALELERMYQRSGLQSNRLSFEYSPKLAKHLADKGYDKKYGARPLKRTVESELLEPLSEILSEKGDKTLKVRATVNSEDQIEWMVEGLDDRQQQLRSKELCALAFATRRRAQKYENGKAFRHIKNTIHRLHRSPKRKKKNASKTAEEILAENKVEELRKTLAGLETIGEKCREVESEALRYFRSRSPQAEDCRARILNLDKELDELCLAFYGARFDGDKSATIILYSQKSADLKLLLDAYKSFWKQRDIEYQLYRLWPGKRETEEQKKDDILRLPYGEELEDRALWCQGMDGEKGISEGLVGIAVELVGERVLCTMASEAGLHAFSKGRERTIEVVVTGQALKKYSPPEDLHLGKLRRGAKRRLYDRKKNEIVDSALDRRLHWKGKILDGPISRLIVENVQRLAEEACS